MALSIFICGLTPSNDEEFVASNDVSFPSFLILFLEAGLNTRIISSKQIDKKLGRDSESVELSKERRAELINEANQLNRIPRNRKIDADVEAELQEIKENSNFDTNYSTLTINRDEYTDDFRRVQEESRRMLPKEVSQYHKGILPKEHTDTLARSLGAVYARLLSRNLTSSVGSRSLTSEK